MKVCIYRGLRKLVAKSGVGRAEVHQAAMLRSAGVTVTRSIWSKCRFVHINTVFPDAILAALVSRITGKTVIYYAHSTMEDFRNSFRGSNFFAPLFKKWIKFCYNMGDVIITPSDYSKLLIEGYGIKKQIYALSNGVDTGFLSAA